MGGRRIFLKNLRDITFNKDLSNEPNFGRIHLAGHSTFKTGAIHFCHFFQFWLI
jgi:hypothetical protein